MKTSTVIQLLSLTFLVLAFQTSYGQATVTADDGVVLGNNTGTVNGTIRYNGSDFQGRVGGTWTSLTSGGSSSPWTTAGSDIYYLNEVGIGTTAPTSALHLKVSGSDGIKMDGNGSGDLRGLWMDNGGGSHFIFDDNSDGHSLDFQSGNAMNFMTGGNNERMQIGQNGEVGIGVDWNTNYRLRVETSSDLWCIGAETQGGQAVRAINSESGNTNSTASYGSISSSTAGGNLWAVYGFVNFNAPAAAKYAVYGTSDSSDSDSWAVYANGDLSYTGSFSFISDERMKKDVQPLESVLDRVMQVETKRYEMRNDEYPHLNLADGPQIGFISQNIEGIFPELVESQTHAYVTNDTEEAEMEVESQEILALSATGMIPILTKAIQEQQVIIDELVKQNELIMAQLAEKQ